MADLKGLKRICMSCGARFYDLNKKPIICPSCNTEFTGEIKVKSRRGRLAGADIENSQVDEETEAEELDTEETEEIEQEDNVVSLEDVDEDADDADDEDLDMEDGLDIDEDLDDDIDDEDIDEDIAEDDEEK